MKRRAPGETVAQFHFRRTRELAETAHKAARWVADNSDAIRECDPVIPDVIYNRAADNWAPLRAAAEVIGGHVVERAKLVALAACGVDEEPSQGVVLLADIRDVFKENGGRRLPAPIWLQFSLPSLTGLGVSATTAKRSLKICSRATNAVCSKDVGSKQKRVKGYALAQRGVMFPRACRRNFARLCLTPSRGTPKRACACSGSTLRDGWRNRLEDPRWYPPHLSAAL